MKNMLTNKEILEIAERYLKKIGDPNSIDLIIVESIEKPYGVIYYFNSKKFISTGDLNFPAPLDLQSCGKQS